MEAVAAAVAPTTDDKITCHIDGVRVHTIQGHLTKNHPEWTIDRYQSEFPGAPILSPFAEAELKRRREIAARSAPVAQPAAPTVAAVQSSPVSADTGSVTANLTTTNAPFHEVFGLGNAPAALNAQGLPIQISIVQGHNQDTLDYVPDVDKDYVFDIDLLKKVIVGFQLNMPTYLWGMHGTGKTSIFEQASAYTKRPFMRVQHTLNMQESEVLGQYVVRDGETPFQLGPLPYAMLYGCVYCADEYDCAMPNVTTLYQPVLEGKALIIKDAPPMFRKITPHPNFRFVATGNTNGIGDETGLYQGTLMQNAANYSRFKITEEVKYMAPELEISVLQSRTRLPKKHAAKIVELGNKIRKSFTDGGISMTVSTRELISAAELGLAFGGKWSVGMNLAFCNRLSRVDNKTVGELMQRAFGE